MFVRVFNEYDHGFDRDYGDIDGDDWESVIAQFSRRWHAEIGQRFVLVRQDVDEDDKDCVRILRAVAPKPRAKFDVEAA